MNFHSYPSVLLENVVNELSMLPSVGRKTALRLALYLLRQDEQQAAALGKAIVDFRHQVHYCSECHNISDTDRCAICSDSRRDHTTVCVVEHIGDVMAIENTQQYRGVYHVLGGIISPMNGISPSDLQIASLIERVAAGSVREVILALNADIESDTTCFYIYKKLSPHTVKLTTIARGIAVGDTLEYADEITLGRSIVNRVAFSLSSEIKTDELK
ncbi:MAG: recombination mediator RecR [Prevotellaceae bacterium]|jgi:recombination protein RecR|nr:recombination mediator RecR [Prevotellaceae bacterium]